MLSSRGRLKLLDIREHIGYALTWTAGLSLAQFRADIKIFYAVTRALEIISEASRGVDEATRQRQSHLPWADIAGAGNIYRHNYDDVTEERVWFTVVESLPLLLAAVEAELAAPDQPSRP